MLTHLGIVAAAEAFEHQNVGQETYCDRDKCKCQKDRLEGEGGGAMRISADLIASSFRVFRPMAFLLVSMSLLRAVASRLSDAFPVPTSHASQGHCE
jgi:hypothetical protein